MNFTDYAQKTLEGLPNTKSAYLYKQEVIAKMTERANQLIRSGLNDTNVINELVISEFRDIEEQYYIKMQIKKRRAKTKRSGALVFLGVVGYILAIIVFYLCVSFASGMWAKSWLILVAGILLPVAAAMLYSATKAVSEKSILAFGARILVAGSVFVVATVIFLTLLMFTGIAKSWLVFPGAVIACLAADCAIAFCCKQKSAIISLLLYIPAISTLAYVMLGVTGIMPWHPGWLIIIFAVIADVGIIAARIFAGARKDEEDEIWEDA